MKRRDKRRDPEPTPEPAHIAAAQAAFQTAVPGVGVCDRCWQPTDSRTHRKRCEG